jgi:hypothetical protein
MKRGVNRGRRTMARNVYTRLLSARKAKKFIVTKALKKGAFHEYPNPHI